MTLKAIALNATLKTSPAPSSTEHLIRQLTEQMPGMACEIVRLVDHAIAPGVTSDEGDGDDWPDIRRKIVAADILIFGTPIWLGQPSSVAKRALERMDAFLGETDEGGDACRPSARSPAWS
jgi:multimeric flavodoxin WrbA